MAEHKRSFKRWAAAAAILCLLIFSFVAIRAIFQLKDRHPGYRLELSRTLRQEELDKQDQVPLKVGFGRQKITPDLKRLSPVWLAGFNQGRAATVVHDDLYAIAIALEAGSIRLAILSIDAIGLFHDQVIELRKRLSPALGLDYLIVCSTHNHSTPDLLGLWGPSPLQSGVNRTYRNQVLEASAQAVEQACRSLTPCKMALLQIPVEEQLVIDTRPPIVIDSNLWVFYFTRVDSATCLGSLVIWPNHPETVWSQNTEITADFCGYLRDGWEHGIREDGRLLEQPIGGICCYVNGAIGGLITTPPSLAVTDPYTGITYRTPSHEKARALGRSLLRMIRNRLDRPVHFEQKPVLGIWAKTIELPVENKLFLAAAAVGIIDRGLTRKHRIRSEIALLRIGPATIACVPGEIYPELMMGKIENPPGADFQIEPIETPPLYDLLPGQAKLTFGLANDEIGYIIPKSEWDHAPPYLYGAAHPPYGEINSLGPDTAPLLHRAFQELVREAQSTIPPNATHP